MVLAMVVGMALVLAMGIFNAKSGFGNRGHISCN